MAVEKYLEGLFVQKLGMEPTAGQRELFAKLGEFLTLPQDDFPILVVRGYAGTGKTTAISAFIKVLKDLKYKYTCTKSDHETLIEIKSPPIKFAPDGILFYNNEYRLLEIKTSEFSSFDKLSAPKPHHMDQVKCYCTLLDLDSALLLYQDRQYESLKCFEVRISQADRDEIWNMFEDVMLKVKQNIAPPKLPAGDGWCNPSHCRYYNKCKEW